MSMVTPDLPVDVCSMHSSEKKKPTHPVEYGVYMGAYLGKGTYWQFFKS